MKKLFNLALIAMVGGLLAGCTGQQAVETDADAPAAEQVEEGKKGLMDGLKDTAAGAADSVKNTAKETASKAADATKEVVKDAANKVNDTVQNHL